MDAFFDDIVEIISFVYFENIRDVLPENISGVLTVGGLSHFLDDADHVVEQTRPFVCQALALTRDGNTNTRPPTTDDVNRLDLVSMDVLNIAKVRHIRESLFQYPAREWLNLSVPDWLNPTYESGQFKRSRPGKQTSKLHTILPFR